MSSGRRLPGAPLPPPPVFAARQRNGEGSSRGISQATNGASGALAYKDDTMKDLVADAELEVGLLSNGSTNGGVAGTAPLSSASARLMRSPLPPPPRMPGRPRRRAPLHPNGETSATVSGPPSNGHMSAEGHRRRRKQGGATSSSLRRLMRRIPIVRNLQFASSSATKKMRPTTSVLPAIILWYVLGVLSIATTKILLTHHNVRPLTLSVQQFTLGAIMLHVALKHNLFASIGQGMSNNGVQNFPSTHTKPILSLFLTGFFFSLGFVATNFSFHESSASFVETVKAAEPITSAIVAVTWGVDKVGPPEAASLLTVVFGVILSTIGNSVFRGARHRGGASAKIPLSSSIQSCIIVMLANLCFSFRGLHQKLLRSTPQGHASTLDDMNLQYRMQQIGIAVFLLPAVVMELPNSLGGILSLGSRSLMGESSLFMRYCGLALVNGLAFASYNLASTYVLSRLTVIHHAALNCCRRLFAIIITSFIFGVSISPLGMLGILVSFSGFMSFTHYKWKRMSQPRPLSSLLPMSAV